MKNNGVRTIWNRRWPVMWTIAILVLVSGMRGAQGQGHDMSTMSAPATATAPAAPPGATVTVDTTVEEGKKQLVATVRLNGKAVEGAKVSFGAKRLFGVVDLGHDATLDDGTAAIAFPADLPGDQAGMLHFVVDVASPASVAGTRTELTLPGGRVVAMNAPPFPRALWAPQAPVELILVIVLLLTGAWGAYAYVVSQLIAIRKGANS